MAQLFSSQPMSSVCYDGKGELWRVAEFALALQSAKTCQSANHPISVMCRTLEMTAALGIAKGTWTAEMGRGAVAGAEVPAGNFMMECLFASCSILEQLGVSLARAQRPVIV